MITLTDWRVSRKYTSLEATRCKGPIPRHTAAECETLILAQEKRNRREMKGESKTVTKRARRIGPARAYVEIPEPQDSSVEEMVSDTTSCIAMCAVFLATNPGVAEIYRTSGVVLQGADLRR